jgi:hypothetical protein
VGTELVIDVEVDVEIVVDVEVVVGVVPAVEAGPAVRTGLAVPVVPTLVAVVVLEVWVVGVSVVVRVTVVRLVVVVGTADGPVGLPPCDAPLKKVVGCPLPVIELPASRSGTVNTTTTIAKAARPVAPATRHRICHCRGVNSRVRERLGVFLALALTVSIGRRRVSDTSAMITGAAAAPKIVPGPQMWATAYDAAADARLAMSRVCSEIPLRGSGSSRRPDGSGGIRHCRQPEPVRASPRDTTMRGAMRRRAAPSRVSTIRGQRAVRASASAVLPCITRPSAP